MGKGRRVRQRRQAAVRGADVQGVVLDALLRVSNFRPATVREALTTGFIDGQTVPEVAIAQAEDLDVLLSSRGWVFESRLCGLGGQLGWSYPPSRIPVTDEPVQDISILQLDVSPQLDVSGGYVAGNTLYVELAGADPCDDAWEIPASQMAQHLDTIETHHAGAPDPFPRFQVGDA